MNLLSKSNIEPRMLTLFLGDLFLTFTAFHFTNFVLKLDMRASELLEIKIAAFSLPLLFFSFLIELYNTRRIFDRSLLLFRPFLVAFLTFIFLEICYYLIPYLAVDDKFLGFSLLTFFLLQAVWHNFFLFVMGLPALIRPVMILGTGPKAEKIAELLNTTDNNFILRGYISTPFDSWTVPDDEVLADTESILDVVKNEKVHTIVMALSERRGNLPIENLLTCKLLGTNIVELPAFYETLTGKLPVEDIDPSWFINNSGFRITGTVRMFKRISDLFFSSVGIVLALPILPVVALMIKMSSKGPIIYKQIRTGELEEDFHIYKFRTMRQDAESKGNAIWAQKNDSRVTGVGSFLRKTRLDELPQLFNILKGDMSFVGPRPERPEFVRQIKGMTKYYGERHFVKPGLTGWAQVKYEYGASFGDSIEKLRYDLYYVKNMSFFMDLLITLETIKVVIFRRGGR